MHFSGNLPLTYWHEHGPLPRRVQQTWHHQDIAPLVFQTLCGVATLLWLARAQVSLNDMLLMWQNPSDRLQMMGRRPGSLLCGVGMAHFKASRC
jgi:hypothetical protein